MANRYHANYAAQTTKPSGIRNIITFYATDDTDAGNIAGVLDDYTLAKRVSLSKAIHFDNSGDYPEGTPDTATSIIADADEGVWKFRCRNAKSGLVEAALVALLKGDAYSAGGITVAALSAPPGLPNTGKAVASVRNYTKVWKGAGA